jgi:hypothetical protein
MHITTPWTLNRINVFQFTELQKEELLNKKEQSFVKKFDYESDGIS